MEGADLHPKDHSIQLFADASNDRQGRKAAHKCSRAEGGFSGPSKFQGPIPKPNSVGCYGQLNSSSLHKQTRRNPLGRDVLSPVEDHDLVPSVPDNLKIQTHSRVSECDGQPSEQVKPSPVNRIVTAFAGVIQKKIRQSSCLVIVIALGWPGFGT